MQSSLTQWSGASLPLQVSAFGFGFNKGFLLDVKGNLFIASNLESSDEEFIGLLNLWICTMS